MVKNTSSLYPFNVVSSAYLYNKPFKVYEGGIDLRELKFRVWDKVRKKMFKPQAISFDINSSDPFAVSVPGKSWEPVGKFELLQWTGFSDKNGIDVYEADLVQISSDTYSIVWNETLATFELVKLGSSLRCNINTITSGSVIGNEFQKSDLYLEKH